MSAPRSFEAAGVAAPPRAAEVGLVDGELRERLQQLLADRAPDEAELAEQPHPQVARLAQRARERRVRRRVRPRTTCVVKTVDETIVG